MNDAEKKRAYDRERLRMLRAEMSEEERAEARREADALYRERHREARRKSQMDRYYRERGELLMPKSKDHVQGFYSAITPFTPDTIYKARLQVAGRAPKGDVLGLLNMLGIGRES